jgi:hypothetical protein
VGERLPALFRARHEQQRRAQGAEGLAPLACQFEGTSRLGGGVLGESEHQ